MEEHAIVSQPSTECRMAFNFAISDRIFVSTEEQRKKHKPKAKQDMPRSDLTQASLEIWGESVCALMCVIRSKPFLSPTMFHAGLRTSDEERLAGLGVLARNIAWGLETLGYLELGGKAIGSQPLPQLSSWFYRLIS